jgi:hypothetical protein
MKRLILLAAIMPPALLAACSQEAATPEATEAAVPAEATVAEVEGGLAIDGKPNAGSYEVTSADGATVTTQTVNADGTLTAVTGDKTTKATWTSTGPGNWCVTEGGNTEAKCYVETISEGGVYTSTNEADPADSWTVKRLS